MNFSSAFYNIYLKMRSEFNFELVMKRRPYFPVMTLVIPCIITSVLLCLTFLVPPDAGEKVGLSKDMKIS